MKSFSGHFLIAAGLFAMLPAACAADAPPPHGIPTAAFGTAASAEPDRSMVPAAVVDGHVIPLSSVTAACLRSSRARVVDQLVQNYVVERECRRRGIVVSEEAIDARIEKLRAAAAPQTLEQLIASHHSTLAEVREDFRREMQRVSLVADQVPPPRMAHCRTITIPFCPSGVPLSVAGTSRTEAEANVVLAECRKRIAAGQAIPAAAELADLGVLYEGRPGMDPALVSAGLAMKMPRAPEKNSVPAFAKTWNTLNLLQVVSTSEMHAPAENALYAAALSVYKEQQAQFLAPAFVVGLISKSQIKFIADSALAPPNGGQIPLAAAVVDGVVIPAQKVVSACLAADGPRVTALLVQNYVVDEECRRRGIQVSEVEIDRRVEALKRLLAPHTIDEGLAMHHLTPAVLREGFKQDIERVRLVSGQVRPPLLVRCRLIEVPRAVPAAQNAEQTLAAVRRQLQAGVSFASLAARYPAPEMPPGQDTLVFFAGMHDMDTAVLHAALALHRNEVSTEPIKTAVSYCLLQAVSTGSDHTQAENAQYQEAAAVEREQQAQPLIPQLLDTLLKKSKIVYYVHN